MRACGRTARARIGSTPSTESGKFIVHNYGHGGAGITLSWGCAAKVRGLVDAPHRGSSQDKKAVAVLGSGVMGLTAAMLLSDLNVKHHDLFGARRNRPTHLVTRPAANGRCR